jgi:hypothetical protein
MHSMVAAVMVVTLGLAIPAAAQELAAFVAVYAPFGIDDLDGGLPPSAEFRLSLPLSDRFALEPFASVGAQRGHGSAGLEGFYGVQMRQRIAALTRENLYGFATYGVSSYYSRYGSQPPVIGHVGFGMHQRVSRRVAFRPEVQVVTFYFIPIGGRFLAGVSLDLAR